MSARKKVQSLIYNPNDVATLGQEYIRYKQDNKAFGVPFPSFKLSDRVYPMFPGEVMSIVARPGHTKTGLMMFWARQRANWLKKNAPNRISIYATWEQSVEELHSFYIAAQQKISITKMARGDMSTEDWQKVKQASADRISEPLWFIGHSVMRMSGRSKITTETLANALEEVMDWGGEGFEVDSLFVDYLQRIPVDSNNPVMSYSAIMDDLKNMSLGFGVPIIVGVQASREVEQLEIPIPEMHHAQWTSNIEQSSDRVLSLVRPRKYRKEGEKFGSITVKGYTQLLISVLKQKLGDANFAEWLNFNPIYNVLDDGELKNPLPDGG